MKRECIKKLTAPEKSKMNMLGNKENGKQRKKDRKEKNGDALITLQTYEKHGLDPEKTITVQS
jgi:hypothetical protein